ncbi:MAG: hypothetical protein ACK5AZ_11290 [Bryobacteraceae bacterium]
MDRSVEGEVNSGFYGSVVYRLCGDFSIDVVRALNDSRDIGRH